ncbi:trafficking protein particle complex subunit 6B-like [Branchiostoma floridae]|uniref:Trafficking protein particle complex subunit 6B-like n=1 Tax=Branchiostoma floridae TaxID=7739 RepID=A0A9J7N0L3_BRAFL|nr:trafficking protein particle complex subunit 6B-like [Branchiostoma floridae]
MADEALFEFLHMEVVSYLFKTADEEKCIPILENMGYRVGHSLAERFTKDSSRFKDELDIMKFICKDFWTSVYKKQVDNLRTNHQYLAFPCGLIRGALANLGISCIVTAEVQNMPACKFQIMIQRSQ